MKPRIDTKIRIDKTSRPDMLGYTLHPKAGALSQQVKFTLPGHLFTRLGFPECPCCIECAIYSQLCYVYGLMVLD